MVLHTTRALDTSLRELLTARSVPLPPNRALGGYLLRFQNHSSSSMRRLSPPRRQSFQSSIVTKRNRYLHESDAYPDSLGTDSILREVHACLSEVLAL